MGERNAKPTRGGKLIKLHELVVSISFPLRISSFPIYLVLT